MAIGFLDVPHEAVEEAAAATQTKRDERVCRVLPSSRFLIQSDGNVFFCELTCDRVGGDSTGVGALSCRNCARAEVTP
jgi:hypothetical protein